jgi:hypothetical protein
MKRGLMVVSAAVVLAAPAVSAQTAMLVARADSLLMAGEVVRAEALYYAVSRRSPRDSQGRAALGQYLASRGAFKIGATLLEEAIAFGGDTATLAARRAPVLQAGDEWVDLAQLSHSPLSDAQRERARWLATHAPAVTGADSVTVAFEPSSAEGFGRMHLIVGSDTLAADIDPSSDELTLGDYTHFAKQVQVFSGEGGGRAGVLLRAKIGDIVLERMPTQFDPQLGPARARIGLSLLAKLAPTVDAAAGVLTLRRDGIVGEMKGRRRIPVLFAFPGVLIARPDHLVRMESPAGRALLATARWTLDLRRGELVLELDK